MAFCNDKFCRSSKYLLKKSQTEKIWNVYKFQLLSWNVVTPPFLVTSEICYFKNLHITSRNKSSLLVIKWWYYINIASVLSVWTRARNVQSPQMWHPADPGRILNNRKWPRLCPHKYSQYRCSLLAQQESGQVWDSIFDFSCFSDRNKSNPHWIY